MPNGLFKYFSTERDKLERFTNGQVYLTPPKHLNDPWEFRLRHDPPTEEDVTKHAPFLDSADATELLKHVRNQVWLEEAAAEQRERLSRMIGLVCLTERPLDRLMWSHYGESHRGFVAEFRHSDQGISESGFPLCDTRFGPALKVDYQTTSPFLKQDLSNMEEVVRTKHYSWKYEDEWRVMRFLCTGDPHPTKNGFVLVWFKPTDLLRVIFGLQVCPNVKFQLMQLLNRKEFEHVRKEEVYIDPSSRELNSRLIASEHQTSR